MRALPYISFYFNYLCKDPVSIYLHSEVLGVKASAYKKEKYCVVCLICGIFLGGGDGEEEVNFIETENRIVVSRARRRGKWEDIG